MPAFTLQPQSITALWLVLISPSHGWYVEGWVDFNRLSLSLYRLDYNPIKVKQCKIEGKAVTILRGIKKYADEV